MHPEILTCHTSCSGEVHGFALFGIIYQRILFGEGHSEVIGIGDSTAVDCKALSLCFSRRHIILTYRSLFELGEFQLFDHLGFSQHQWAGELTLHHFQCGSGRLFQLGVLYPYLLGNGLLGGVDSLCGFSLNDLMRRVECAVCQHHKSAPARNSNTCHQQPQMCRYPSCL